MLVALQHRTTHNICTDVVEGMAAAADRVINGTLDVFFPMTSFINGHVVLRMKRTPTAQFGQSQEKVHLIQFRAGKKSAHLLANGTFTK